MDGPGAKTVILVVVVVTATAAVGILAGGMGWVLLAEEPRAARDGAPASQGAASEERDPLQPHIDLRFSGACAPRFDGRIFVQSGPYGHLRIASMRGDQERSVLAIYPREGHPIGGTIELTQAYFDETGNQIELTDGTVGGWGNHRSGPVDEEHDIGGVLRVQRFEPTRGIASLVFEGVVLRHWSTGSACTVDGRLETFGLTWGT